MPIFSFNLPLPELRRFLPICLLLVLTGCATVTDSQSGRTPSGQIAASPRTYHEAIDITGRLSLRYEQNGKEESLHGSFNWSQHSRRQLLTLSSPLGQTMATIENTASMATLKQAGQSPRTAADVDLLTSQTLGWPLPVAGLRYWLQGFAVKPDGSQFVAAPGSEENTAVTTQDGWHLNYASWNQEAALPHPRRIDLQRDTVQAGRVEIRLIIDTWQISQGR